MRALRLLRIELTVAVLERAEAFYLRLGFKSVSAGAVSAHRARLMGAAAVREVILRRGGQEIALQEFAAAGAPYPADARACDLVFQHFAMPVADTHAAMATLSGVTAISRGGPQHLPQRSGGATAFKFRDPDGHPLELIQLPGDSGNGIDHSAIVVSDAGRSIDFYRETLGLELAARQLNTGPAQDRLDGVDGAVVEVVALQPRIPAPHLELLAYRSPTPRNRQPLAACDIAATRLVFEVSGGKAASMIEDPDGHKLVLVPEQ